MSFLPSSNLFHTEHSTRFMKKRCRLRLVEEDDAEEGIVDLVAGELILKPMAETEKPRFTGMHRGVTVQSANGLR